MDNKKLVFVFGPESRLRTSNEDTIPPPKRHGADAGPAVILGQYSFRMLHGVASEYEKCGMRYYARVLSKDDVVDLERIDGEVRACRRKLLALEGDRQQILELAVVDARLVREGDIP